MSKSSEPTENKGNHSSALERLDYSGSLDSLVDSISEAFQIGEVTDSSVIEVGYEDCNVVLDTKDESYVAKMFAKTRSQSTIDRYVTIMENVVSAGVSHPPLETTVEGGSVYRHNGVSLVLMRYIPGKTFFELGRAPSQEERLKVLEQAAKVGSIKHHPPYLGDSWSITKLGETFGNVREYVPAADMPLVQAAMTQYESIPTQELPRGFVHGDFTKANVLKADSEDIYILDFSVANWYPRIHELAVIIANLLHDSRMGLKDRTERVASEYEQFIRLTAVERRHLYSYTLAAVAMEFLGSLQERHLHGNDSVETDYWFTLGQTQLREALG